MRKNILTTCIFLMLLSRHYYVVGQRTIFASGFETGAATFTYNGVQVPYNSTAVPNIGSNHGRIDGGCSGGTSGCYNGSIITPLLTFVPGCTYTVSFYTRRTVCPIDSIKVAKSATATNAAMTIAEGNDVIQVITGLGGTYTYFSSTFSVASLESKFIGFRLFYAGGGGCSGSSNRIYIDDILITKSCSQCENGVQDGDETGIDCGGTICESIAPVGGTATSTDADPYVCGAASGTFVLSVTGFTGYIQWQSSTDGVSYYDIGGGNNCDFNATIPNNTTYYKIKTINDNCPTEPDYSNVITVSITGTTANTWLTSGTTAWGTDANWSAGVKPTACHNVSIPTGGTQPTISAAAVCNNLTVDVGAELTVGATTLQVSGNLINNGTINDDAGFIDLVGKANTIGGTGVYWDATGPDQAGWIRTLSTGAGINYTLTSNLTLDVCTINTGGSINLGSYTLITTSSSFVQAGYFYAGTGTLRTQGSSSWTTSKSFWQKGTFYLDWQNLATNASFGIADDYYNLIFSSSPSNKNIKFGPDAAGVQVLNDFTILDATTNITNAGTILVGGSALGGDWTNNGTYAYGTSTVEFVGVQPQTIGGTSVTTFYNLAINNTSALGVTLNQDANIASAGTLTLTDGMLFSSATNLLSVLDGGLSTSGSSVSFVDGPIKKIGNELFIFPTGDDVNTAATGDEYWAPIEISAPATSTTEFTAQYLHSFAPQPTYDTTLAKLTSPLQKVSQIEYWTLDRAITSDNVSVKLHWKNATNSSINDCSSGDLVVAHWNTGTGKWEDVSNPTPVYTGTCGAGQAGTVSSNGVVSSFSPFTFGSKSRSQAVNSLPVELLELAAYPNNDKIKLTWSTATEINNDYFTIERSKDGKEFEPVVMVRTKAESGNSSIKLDYIENDNKPYSGLSYYRLKQTDIDGKYSYSNIIAVDLKEGIRNLYVYPNPANDKLNIITADNETATVKIYDVTGQIVAESVVCGKPSGICSVDIASLADGVYFVSLSNGQDTRYARFVKE